MYGTSYFLVTQNICNLWYRDLYIIVLSINGNTEKICKFTISSGWNIIYESNETLSSLLDLCKGNPATTGGYIKLCDLITFPCDHTMLIKIRLMVAVIWALRRRSEGAVFVTGPRGTVINTWSDSTNNGDTKDKKEFLAKFLMQMNKLWCPLYISHILTHHFHNKGGKRFLQKSVLVCH